MQSYGKRICGLSAFVLFTASLFPLFSPAQDPLRFRLEDQERRLEKLSGLPSEVAVIREQISSIREQVTELRSAQDQIKNSAFAAAVGILAWIGAWLFQWFGGRTKKDA